MIALGRAEWRVRSSLATVSRVKFWHEEGRAIEDREFLMIPGPVSIDDEVLEALARPVRAHYGDEWTQLYKHAVAGMRQVFRTEGEVHLLFGSGMAGVEMCIASVLGPGDEVLVAANGLFGERMAEVATANGLRVHTVGPELAGPVTAARMREALATHQASGPCASSITRPRSASSMKSKASAGLLASTAR